MRMLSIALAALAASALIVPSPATAQHRGGMGGGAMMHSFNGGGFHGGFRGGMGGYRSTFRPGFRGGFRGFRRGPVILPGWGWGWGWGPGWGWGWDWAPPPCQRWWWDGWGWRCAW